METDKNINFKFKIQCKIHKNTKVKIMILILTKSDLLRPENPENKILSFEDFKSPMSLFEGADSVVYLNGNNGQILKTRDHHPRTEIDWEGLKLLINQRPLSNEIKS